MRFTYTVLKEDKTNPLNAPTRIDITDKWNDIVQNWSKAPYYIDVYDNMLKRITYVIRTPEQYDEWNETLARGLWQKDKYPVETPAAEVPNGIGTGVASTLVDDKWKVYHPLEQEVTQDKIAMAVNPKHHKNYIDEYQWIDAMSRIPSMRDPKVFLGAVELQVRKYLDRIGKDSNLQELKKSKWYLEYMIAYIENDCKPIKANDLKDHQ